MPKTVSFCFGMGAGVLGIFEISSGLSKGIMGIKIQTV